MEEEASKLSVMYGEGSNQQQRQQQDDSYNSSQQHEGCFDDGITIDADSLDASCYAVPTFCTDENQLTLSFRGQVFVFDSVTPDKVQAVLLLLGGNSLPPGDTTPPPSQSVQVAHLSQQGGMEYAKRCNHPQREASLHRFRQKRKERCFDKKIRYDVRQEVALRMQRKKGQFTSSKSDDSSGCNGQDSGLDETQLETLCTHCGISSKLTPMMRRGPRGPRTLCNACGLFWATKPNLGRRGLNTAIPSAKCGHCNFQNLNKSTVMQYGGPNLLPCFWFYALHAYLVDKGFKGS